MSVGLFSQCAQLLQCPLEVADRKLFGGVQLFKNPIAHEIEGIAGAERDDALQKLGVINDTDQ